MIFKKKKKLEEVNETEGLKGLKYKLNIPKFILKMGGLNNISAVKLDNDKIIFDIKKNQKVSLHFFRTNKVIKNLFFTKKTIGWHMTNVNIKKIYNSFKSVIK